MMIIRVSSLTALLLFVIAVGCNRKQGPSDSGKGDSKKVVVQDANKAGAVKDGGPKADVSMDAAVWRIEFKKDKLGAWEKYKGKLIELTGEVDSVTDGADGVEGIIYLKPSDMTEGVKCYVADRPWTRVAVGSHVKVRGKLSETSEDESLHSATLVESGPAPPVVGSVDIAKQFAADPAKAREKFNNQRLNIEGKLTDVDVRDDPQQGKFYVFTLAGDSGVSLICGLSARAKTKEMIEAAKAGRTAKVFGTLLVPDDAAAKTIRITAPTLTDVK